jgi:hypothetical protein
LNDYKTRTEQLDNELKNCMKIKAPDSNSLINDNHQHQNCNQDWVTQKSESIQTELSKLKSG